VYLGEVAIRGFVLDYVFHLSLSSTRGSGRRRNKVKAVEAGAVPVIVELLLEYRERKPCEMNWRQNLALSLQLVSVESNDVIYLHK